MDWLPKWCWELTFGTKRRISHHCTCRQDTSLGETMKWLHPIHFKWWMPSLPSTAHFLGFRSIMQCKRHQKDFYWEKMMRPGAGILSSLPLSGFLRLRWAAHILLTVTHRRQHCQRPVTSHLDEKCWVKHYFFHWEKASREKSGVDNLPVISTSGTESLIPSNLSLWSHCNAPSRWPQCTRWESEKLMADQTRWHVTVEDRSPECRRLSHRSAGDRKPRDKH